MTVRAPITGFELANPIYKNATISFWTVASGAKTSTLATLYSGQTGSSRLANPQKLNSHGQFKRPVYIDDQIIGTVSGISVPPHDTGIHSPIAPTFRVNATTGELQYSYNGGITWLGSGETIFLARGAWVTGTDYSRNDTVFTDDSFYLSLVEHTSGVFATDLAAGKWLQLLGDFGFIQAGTGAEATTTQTKQREIVSVTDFMTTAEKANYAAGTGQLWDAVEDAVTYCKDYGKDLFHPAGACVLNTSYPVGQEPIVGETVNDIIDYGGMTIFGTGKQSLIRTEPTASGADVFRMCLAQNLTLRDIALHSILPTPNTEGTGSNGVSFSHGARNITVERVHCFVLPYVTGASLDGGSAFTIQQGGDLGMNDLRVINCTADGGTYGLAYIGGGVAASNTDPITGVVWRGNTLKSFFHGITVTTSFTGAEAALPTQSFSVLGNKAIDCQYGAYLEGSTGINLASNEIMSTLATAIDPATGAAWLASDTTLFGLHALSIFNSNIVCNIIYEAACSNFMRFGGGASAQADTPSRYCNIAANQMFGVASGYGLAAGGSAAYGRAENCKLIGNNISGYTGSAIDPLFGHPDYSNTIVDETGSVLRGVTLAASVGSNFAVDSGFDIASTSASPVAPWTPGQPTWAVAGGKGVATLAITSQAISQLVNLTAGKAYRLSVVVSGYSGTGTGGFYVIGTVASGFTDNLIKAAQWSGNGTYTRVFTPALTGVYRIGLGSIGGGGTEYNASHDDFTITELSLTAEGDVFFSGSVREVIPTFANNAAALAGGLTPGQHYRVNAATDPEPLYIAHA